jgi:hypothetical protein
MERNRWVLVARSGKRLPGHDLCRINTASTISARGFLAVAVRMFVSVPGSFGTDPLAYAEACISCA